GRRCAWRPESGGRRNVGGIVVVGNVWNSATCRAAYRQRSGEIATGKIQLVVRYSDVIQGYVTCVGNGDPIAERRTVVWINSHAKGEFLSGQVRIECFANIRIAHNLLIDFK